MCSGVADPALQTSPDLPRRLRASRSLPYTLGGGTRHERYENGPEQAYEREGVEAPRHGEPGTEEKPADKRPADGPDPADTRGPAQGRATTARGVVFAHVGVEQDLRAEDSDARGEDGEVSQDQRHLDA